MPFSVITSSTRLGIVWISLVGCCISTATCASLERSPSGLRTFDIAFSCAHEGRFSVDLSSYDALIVEPYITCGEIVLGFASLDILRVEDRVAPSLLQPLPCRESRG